ncbi:hypothetical protein [Sphingomonas sp. Leaf339]|uniref:hypothetical protein n=1 Tax=Sphingomonas sp. Leaf339 TaxID=1736343 RepID=UPI000A935A69|nr:hypothetical protein [Sphingomonas sp. Leaf339]
MYRPIALSLPLLMLAACDSGTTATTSVANTATAAPDGGYAARIKTLSPRLRSGVFLRAIRDAGEECQEVTREFAIAPIENRPAWGVVCDKTNPWVVSIDPNGTAMVTKASIASPSKPTAG